MIQLRKHSERGHTQISWLNSYHSFSFGEYQDERHRGFGALRVLNDDIVAPAQGFATHGHRDMEIITYVLQGALEHKDSLGTGSIIRPGEVQRMSAGTGILHSEFNASATAPVHFLQIWILPERTGIAPSYEQKSFTHEEKTNQFRLVASQDGREGSVQIHQDAQMYVAAIEQKKAVRCTLDAGRKAWVHVASGNVRLNTVILSAGDSAGITDETNLLFECYEDTELLLLDLQD